MNYGANFDVTACKNQASKRLCAGLDKWVTPKKPPASDAKRSAETTPAAGLAASQAATPPKDLPPPKKLRENNAPKDTVPEQGKPVKAEVVPPKVAAVVKPQADGARGKDVKEEAVVEPAAGGGETVLGTGMLGK